MAESAYYMEDLKKPNANLYLYLEAAEGAQGKEAAETFCKYFNVKEYTPKRALALVYLKLQGDGGINIGTKHYQSPDELKKEKDAKQIALLKKAVNEKDSLLLVWLSDIYGDELESTDKFGDLDILEQFFLLGLMPFIPYKEFNYDSWDILKYLIDSCPGRADLFEIYAAQGLPLTGLNDDKMTPIDYVVCNFNKLSKKHGVETVRNLIRLLCRLGADVNEYSDDGTCPLINAFEAFLNGENDLVKLLLELGADADQYRKFIDQQEKQELIKLEEIERHEAEKREFLEKKRHKEHERCREEIVGRTKKKKTQTIITITFIISVFTAVLGYCVYNGWFTFVFNRHLSIPDTVNTIKDGEFASKQLTSVNIPDSVTLIGNKSFSRNGLTSINITDSITSIGERAFWRNKLTSLIIPNGVKSISENAFEGNLVTSVRIGANVKLGNDGTNGILGQKTGFNTAYSNNNNRAGTYTRPNVDSQTRTRS